MWLKFVIHLDGNSYSYVTFMHILTIFRSNFVFLFAVYNFDVDTKCQPTMMTPTGNHFWIMDVAILVLFR